METILVDIDGVLVSGRPQDGAHLFTDLERDLGIPLARLQSEFFALRWPAIVTGRKPLLPELTEVLATLAPAVSAETLIDYWFRNDSRIDRSVLAAIVALRRQGRRVYLATNQEHMRATYLMKEMGLERHVDGMFYSAAIGYRKPDEEFYRYVAAAVETPPKRTVLIDDTEANVMAARAFGWQAVHWSAGMDLIDQLGLNSLQNQLG
ncbi:HAD family hydrolase [Devosia honganensis]|uniref:HAD family hydrolase n=1 Tax=Devosia honganensis TaxID=1610527 RepID=A0ABV7X0Q1_9HYPH